MEREMPMGLRFSLLHRSFKKKMDEMLAEQELTGVQFGVLGALVHMERQGREEISQKDLELATRLGHPTMTEILKRLEKKGYLRRERSTRDRRSKRVRATEKAYSLKEAAAEAENDSFRWLCRGLSEQQVSQLIAITDRMLENACAECGKGSEGTCD